MTQHFFEMKRKGRFFEIVYERERERSCTTILVDPKSISSIEYGVYVIKHQTHCLYEVTTPQTKWSFRVYCEEDLEPLIKAAAEEEAEPVGPVCPECGKGPTYLIKVRPGVNSHRRCVDCGWVG